MDISPARFKNAAYCLTADDELNQDTTMKAQDAKKEKKKTPQKTMKEKKIAKQEKKAKRG